MPTRPKSRRAKGTGSIFYSPKLRLWVGRVPVGRSPRGHTLYRSVQRETERACVEALKTLAPPGPKITVREWCERWFAELSVRSSTRDDYRKTLDTFVIPTLGHVKLAALTPGQVEAATRIWLTRTNPNSTRKNLSQFRACVQSAVRHGLIQVNPVALAKKPKAVRVSTTVFTPEELAAICAEPRAGLFALLAAVGCRSGEALALDVQDFDREAGTVRITKTYSLEHGTRPPKSENGIRTLRIPTQALPAVVRAVGRRTRGPLFPSPDGTRRSYDAIRASWIRLLRRLGLPYRRPHVLRHSAASHMVASGAPLADVAHYLGDALSTVVRVYCHPTGADIAGVIEGLLGGQAVTRKRE